MVSLLWATLTEHQLRKSRHSPAGRHYGEVTLKQAKADLEFSRWGEGEGSQEEDAGDEKDQMGPWGLGRSHFGPV